MTNTKLTKILLSILIITIVIVGSLVVLKRIKKVPLKEESVLSTETSITYKNTQYGFSFTLPISWKGYAIITTTWTGDMIDSQPSQNITGPEIIIRHPLWTSSEPRQDIPIMIFTYPQWNLIQKEKLSLGAAPIPPSEIGRNEGYVFALPARYNFSYLLGFEEVENIIKGKPFHVLML